jgi:ribosomal protein S27E
MPSKKMGERVRCKNCGNALDAIWFTALMTEEWSWDGEGYNECTARHSLITDPDENITCPYCEEVVGTGRDFGFGEGYK